MIENNIIYNVKYIYRKQFIYICTHTKIVSLKNM